jgi:hypothetical protein
MSATHPSKDDCCVQTDDRNPQFQSAASPDTGATARTTAAYLTIHEGTTL